AHGLQKGAFVKAGSLISPIIETRGNHRPVKTRPTSHRVHQQLNDIQVAVADEALRAEQRRAQSEVNQVVRAVASARCNHAVDALVMKWLAEHLDEFL